MNKFLHFQVYLIYSGKIRTLRPNVAATRLTQNFEYGINADTTGQQNPNAVLPVAIDKTTPTERVNAPGFAQMFENFIKGVDQRRKFQKEKHRILFWEDLTIFTKPLLNLRRQALLLT